MTTMRSSSGMGQWQDTYVETRDGEVYVRGTGVSLESIVSFWLQGETPEELHEDFPSVSLGAVYGTVAFYLDHKGEVDALLAEHKAEYEARRAAAEAAEPERYTALRRRFAEIRAQRALPASPDAPVETPAP